MGDSNGNGSGFQALSSESAATLQPPPLAYEPDILERLAETLTANGFPGDTRGVKLLYLVFLTRVLDKPVSVVIKGPSSGGKSYLVSRVLDFFPPDAYYALTAMSEKALVYGKKPLSHRFLVLYEAAGMHGEIGNYLIRSLLSEGRVHYETVVPTQQGPVSKEIDREGPTGLVVTTTNIRLHPENETRLFSIPVEDTREQTHAVMKALAKSDGERHDIDPGWIDLQIWLQYAEHEVVIPYAEALAELVPPTAVRLKRDFAALLSLIKARAILHQATRDRDAQGRVIATLEDYAAVRELVADLIAYGVEASVPSTVRETVEAVADLKRRAGSGNYAVSKTDVARALRLDPSAAGRRVEDAIALGYLVNLEERKERRALLTLGEPLPARDHEILPSADELRRKMMESGEPRALQ